METPLQPTEAPKQGAMGALIGIVLIILIIIAGGVYFWMMKQDTQKKAMESEQETVNQNAQSEKEIGNDIQAATDVNVDAELNDLDKEFGE